MKRLDVEHITLMLHGTETPGSGEVYLPSKNSPHAAVAIILRSGEHHTEALFILRSKKEGDPWSGQIAFPGGHYEARDKSLRHTAERETFEEIGLDLATHARYMGKLRDVQASPRGKQYDMRISPFVYVLENQTASMSPNHEVADILWESLDDMYEGATSTTHYFDVMGKTRAFPGYSVGDQVVWGLTLRMLENFFIALDPGWQAALQKD